MIKVTLKPFKVSCVLFIFLNEYIVPSIYGQTSMEEVVITICAIVVIVVVIGSFFSFLVSLYLLLFSKWDKTKENKAKNGIRYMIIWVVFSVVFLVLLPFVLKTIGVELKDYSAKAIFSKAGSLIQSSFQIGTAVKNGQIDNQYRGNPYINIDNGRQNLPTTSPYQL